MKRFFIGTLICLVACNGGTKETDSTYASDSVVNESDLRLHDSESDPDSMVPDKTHSNAAFREVTVQRTGPDTYTIQGQARIFEANVEWVVEDGHRELKKGFETASMGAPEWGDFTFSIEVKKERPNSTLTLVLFETSMKDGSRRHELAIPLK